MARQMSATQRDGLSTFLLEMALDKARMKARLASVLIDERRQRGKGDARRFPQPEMAALLGYSLRQYQRLEDADDGSLPSWDDLTEILTKLDRPPSDIFGDEEPESGEELQPAAASPGRGLAAEVAEIRVLLEALATAQGLDVEHLLHAGALPDGEPQPEAEDLEAPGGAAQLG